MGAELRTILIATDGSADARDAEAAALDLCRRTGAALHVVHTWSYMPVAANAYPMLPTIGDYSLLEEAARAILDGAATRIMTAGPLAGTHLRCGQSADEIAATAREIGADLVLIGSRGLGPVRRLVLGSVSGAVVQQAPCPVLVTRGGAGAWPPGRVIAGDDGSDNALTAIGVAATIATACEAQLTLVRAITAPPSGSPLDPDPRDGVLGRVEAVLQDRARQVETGAGKQVRVVAGLGDAAALLIEEAEADPTPTLIAVGHRGLHLIERLRLGSTSTKVLHAAHGPVLVVPRQRE